MNPGATRTPNSATFLMKCQSFSGNRNNRLRDSWLVCVRQCLSTSFLNQPTFELFQEPFWLTTRASSCVINMALIYRPSSLAELGPSLLADIFSFLSLSRQDPEFLLKNNFLGVCWSTFMAPPYQATFVPRPHHDGWVVRVKSFSRSNGILDLIFARTDCHTSV